MNESVYYNVDEIADAISRDRQIRFHYFEYTIDKQRHYRKDGAFYIVSPMALMWDNENYYLLAWDAEAQLRKHYRVDKMTDISALDAPREGMEDFSEQDLSAYTKKVFSMFTGEERTVRLRFANHLIGSVLDRFGKDVIVVEDGAEHFTVSLNVVTSPKFYAWLFGFGTNVEILSAAVRAAGNAGDARAHRGYHTRAPTRSDLTKRTRACIKEYGISGGWVIPG